MSRWSPAETTSADALPPAPSREVLAERRHPFVRVALDEHKRDGRKSYAGRDVCTCGWAGPYTAYTDHVAAAVVIRLEREGL